MNQSSSLITLCALVLGGVAVGAAAQPVPATQATSRPMMQPFGTYRLADVRMRDVCILPDKPSNTYYMVGPARRGVRVYTSKDLSTWEGPRVIYTPPDDIWGDVPVTGIWAPEMHAYKGKYYLFLTFDTRTPLAEQWRDWLPRVRRGSQILVGDSPLGPFLHFHNRATLPSDMMTLDGTLWVEAGVPYIVYCHEWVQITNGSIEYVRLSDDLSETVGAAKKMFHGSEAPWSETGKDRGNNVTDGPYIHTGKSGRLYMIWSSGGAKGYVCGIAIADSGKLAGPWRQQREPLFDENGGHGMLFTTFDGRLLMVLHAPNDRGARPRIFEMEDTGETLRTVREFKGS
jgi:GH43 family beta-xylosidase